MTRKYTPSADSIAHKVIEFFRANPEESLDKECIAVKFGCSSRSVHTGLGPAVQAGVLERKENLADGELVYSLGDVGNLGGTKKRQPFQLDGDAVVIEKNVPLPTAFRKGQSNFADIFNRMAVGDSFELPIAGRNLASASITAYKKTHPGVDLATRTLGDKVRVWRLA